MRTITLEEHFATPDFLKATMPLVPAGRRSFVQAVESKLLDLDKGRLAEMDAAGIDMQVLSLTGNGMDALDAATATALARDANDKLAEAVRAHPKRLAGFAFLDDPRFTPIFEAAQALDAAVYLHPSPPPKLVEDTYFGGLPGDTGFYLARMAWGWHAETGMHCLRLIVSGLFDRFPKLKIIIGHMGEDLPFSIARADAILSRDAKHLKRKIGEYFQEHFYITTSGYFTAPPLLCTLQVMGADRVLFSVDYPYSPNAAGRKFLDSLTLSPQDMEKICHGNAERLLKL